MSAAEEQDPIQGWERIRVAVGRRLKQSVGLRTVQRYAQRGRQNRLPVVAYANGRVYLTRAKLELWAQAWEQPTPLGGKPPGRRAA